MGTSGFHDWEVEVQGPPTNIRVGIVDEFFKAKSAPIGNVDHSLGMRSEFTHGTWADSEDGIVFSSGDVLHFELDLEAHTLSVSNRTQGGPLQILCSSLP